MSDFLDRLFMKEHGLRHDEIRRLDRRELRELEDAVSGRRETPNRVRAMSVLTAAEGARAIPLLAAVLRDDQNSKARAAAAASLGFTTLSATQSLSEALETDDDPAVLSSVLGALSKIGSPDVLRTLERLIPRFEEPLVSQASFAAAVVAFRHRRSGYEPDLASYGDLVPPQADQANPISVRALPSDEADLALTQLRPESYGVALDQRATLGLNCTGERLLIALDAEVGAHSEALAAYLAVGPLVAGLIGWRSPVDRTYSTRWLVLTWRGDRVQHLAVHRPYGPPFLFGVVRLEAEGAAFELSSVRSRGNPRVQLSGTLRAGQLELKGLSTAERVERGAPTPLE